MEDGIVQFVNNQNKEHRDRLIEYLTLWDSPTFDEFVARRTKMKRQEMLSTKMYLHNTIMAGLNTQYILEKLKNESNAQSHSS
jgi:hypothetical protein